MYKVTDMQQEVQRFGSSLSYSDFDQTDEGNAQSLANQAGHKCKVQVEAPLLRHEGLFIKGLEAPFLRHEGLSSSKRQEVWRFECWEAQTETSFSDKVSNANLRLR